MDEDVVFVSASAMMGGDLPHPRSLCPSHAFAASGGASNSSFCHNCYCYVCDLLSNQVRVSLATPPPLSFQCASLHRMSVMSTLDENSAPPDYSWLQKPQCKEWGRHCDAHSGSPLWQEQRKRSKRPYPPVGPLVECLGGGTSHTGSVAWAVEDAFAAYHKGRQVRGDTTRGGGGYSPARLLMRCEGEI